jgi:nucleotide-binding universal stress UspA family protein
MKKKILVVVDGSIYSRRAIEYVVKMESVIKDLNLTLLNIHPKISEFLVEDSRIGSKARSALKEVTARNYENSIRILHNAKSLMTKLGVDENQIETVSRPVVKGIAKDIIDYGRKGLYDAIVIGRMGISRLADVFMGNAANSVLEHTSITPVWAIGGEFKSFKIMIAVDGSESALRAVDHVIFMLGENPDIRITLLHVMPRLRDYCEITFEEKEDILEEAINQGHKQCIDDFYAHAQKKIKEAGLKKSQIDIKQVVSIVNIGKSIVDEVKKGNFGTVVIGRKGADDSFFLGGISRFVLDSIFNSAVWLVP